MKTVTFEEADNAIVLTCDCGWSRTIDARDAVSQEDLRDSVRREFGEHRCDRVHTPQ